MKHVIIWETETFSEMTELCEGTLTQMVSKGKPGEFNLQMFFFKWRRKYVLKV